MGNAKTTLQPLNANVLRPGLKLPGHIYNQRGRILKRAGSVLTEEHIELLSAETLTVDGAWNLSHLEDSEEDSIERIVDDIESRKTGANRRRYPRHRWEASIRLKLEERVDGKLVTQQLSVKTSDLSRAGLSFVFTRSIPQGSAVHVRFDDIPGTPHVRGVIRNSVRLDNGTYRVGVEIVNASRSS